MHINRLNIPKQDAVAKENTSQKECNKAKDRLKRKRREIEKGTGGMVFLVKYRRVSWQIVRFCMEDQRLEVIHLSGHEIFIPRLNCVLDQAAPCIQTLQMLCFS